MSKYFKEQKQFRTILGIEKLGTSLKVIWGTRQHKQIFKGNKGTRSFPPPPSPGRASSDHFRNLEWLFLGIVMSPQEKMRGQRGRLPVQPLGYVMSTKVIFRRAEVFRDVRMQANFGPMFERK